MNWEIKLFIFKFKTYKSFSMSYMRGTIGNHGPTAYYRIPK